MLSSKSFSNLLPNASINGNSSSSTHIELSMLELILGEIDACMIENKESSERLRQMIIQMHIYFNEKISDQQTAKNKLLAEFDEYKTSLQTENDQLRCQLKLLQIQNEFSKDNYLMKKASSSVKPQNGSSNPSLPPQMTSNTSSTHSIKSTTSPNNNSNNNILTSQQIQNILMIQQQQQQHQQQLHLNQKNHDLQAAAAAAAVAAQSFPQFFLNHYTPNQQQLQMQQQQQQRSLPQFMDQLTSTPKKGSILNNMNEHNNPFGSNMSAVAAAAAAAASFSQNSKSNSSPNMLNHFNMLSKMESNASTSTV
jgi:hypothetical protein